MSSFDIEHIKQRCGDIEKLISNKWHDDYFLNLAIFDHLQEIVVLLNKWRASKTSDNEFVFNKELMDLFILLLMWQTDERDSFEVRLDKFLSHLPKADQERKNNSSIEVFNGVKK